MAFARGRVARLLRTASNEWSGAEETLRGASATPLFWQRPSLGKRLVEKPEFTSTPQLRGIEAPLLRS